MSNYDIQYANLVRDISLNGISDEDQVVRTKWADGTPAHTKSIFGVQLEFDQLPISTTKKLAWKTAVKEMLIFWVKQSTKMEDFHNANCHVWDEWFLPSGDIGRSYPYQFESRPKREVTKVKTITKEKHGELIKISSGLDKCDINKDSNNKYVGKIITSKTSGDFIILDVWTDKDSRHVKMCKVQFLETNYVKVVQLTQAKNREIKDIYARTVCGIGYIGDYSHIKNFDKEHIEVLHKKWIGMIERCYNKKSKTYKNHGGKGVFVDIRWHCFANFLEDVRYLPQWFLAKESGLIEWSIDKDYYSSNCYSKETCVWLHKKDNVLYQEGSYPVNLIYDNGKKELYISPSELARNNDLLSKSSVDRLCSGEKDSIKGFKIEKVQEDGFVYRYKLSKNQVVDLIDNIKNNPSSRRLMTSFWNDADVDEKALQECAYETIWNVENGTLNLILGQRSLDVGLGCCFNQFQYYVLLCMVAQVCKLKVGKLIHQIGSAHIYTRHFDGLIEQIEREPFKAPVLELNPNVDDLFNFTIDDFKLIGYEYHPTIQFEVAI